MSKYGDIIYGGANYGSTPKLSYSVEPMTVNVISFSETDVNWQNAVGSYSRFRIVRNQNGFSETSEDGVIVYEINSTNGSNLSGTLTKVVLKDGLENTGNANFIPIVAGRNIYYTAFLYTDQQVWVKAGKAYDTVPADTDSLDRMINLLPRTLVSDELTPFGSVPYKTDANKSTIYRFLDGLSFNYEQLLTQAALLKPFHNIDPANYSTIPAEMFSLGLELEENLPIVNQRRLIRDAIYMYSQKGTSTGIKNYSQALTGFLTNISVSPNLLLSVQDSTFYKSIGHWTATNATLSYTDELIPNVSTVNCIDKIYTLKIVASGAGSISLGSSSPVLQGIPLGIDTQYTYSFQVKSPTSAGSVTPSVMVYDANSSLLRTNTGTSTAANNSWKTVSQTFSTLDGDSEYPSYAVLNVAWSAAGTYYIDMVCLQTGAVVAYDEARALTLLLEPSKTNYIPNPSFETDATGWTLTNLTFASDPTNYPMEGFPSLHSGKFTATGTTWQLTNTAPIPVDPGTYFNISMYAYSSTIPMMDMYIDVYDESNNLLNSFHDQHMMGPMWMRHYVGGLMDINTEPKYAYVRFSGMSNPGDSFSLDMVQAQDTYLPTDYFDGSMAASVGVLWQGTANNSASLYYPGKDTKFLRLAQTLVDWIPMNTWWRIATPAGLEYTNLTV